MVTCVQEGKRQAKVARITELRGDLKYSFPFHFRGGALRQNNVPASQSLQVTSAKRVHGDLSRLHDHELHKDFGKASFHCGNSNSSSLSDSFLRNMYNSDFCRQDVRDLC